MSGKNRTIAAFTDLAPRYETVVDSELNLIWGWSYAGFVEKFLDNIPINEDDKILDVATGTGVIPRKLIKERKTRNRIHGLDITLPMLSRAAQRFKGEGSPEQVAWVCASAMDMPYSNASMTLVICCLATHHMDVKKLLSETRRILAKGGRLSFADAGGSLYWKLPGVKLLLRLAGFVYFLFAENVDRAWAEAGAVSNVRSAEEWHTLLATLGFNDIRITKLKSRYFWVPKPLMISAIKPSKEESK
jgi:ubiquinone/menaquinone biosynthesis C-methylase UbiE